MQCIIREKTKLSCYLLTHKKLLFNVAFPNSLNCPNLAVMFNTTGILAASLNSAIFEERSPELGNQTIFTDIGEWNNAEGTCNEKTVRTYGQIQRSMKWCLSTIC